MAISKAKPKAKTVKAVISTAATEAVKKALPRATAPVKKAFVNKEGSLVLPNQMPSKPKTTVKAKMAAAAKKQARTGAKTLSKEKSEAIEAISKQPAATLEKNFTTKASVVATPVQTVAQPKREATVAARFGGGNSTIPSLEIARTNWLGGKR